MGINDNGFIWGLVGPLVNRKVGNKNYLQSMPYRVKQTDDTKIAYRHRVYQKNQDSDKIGTVADNLIQGWNNVFSDL